MNQQFNVSYFPIETVPDDVEYVVVSDMFVEDYTGGAELTLEAILDACPGKYIKIRSKQVTPTTIENAKDKYWILGNFTGMQRDCLVGLATSGAKYSVIECDYKLCAYRSSHLHKLQKNEECNCARTEHGKFIKGLFKRAQKTFFMSQGQLNEYKRVFPVMEKWEKGKLLVQGSTFKQETLDYLNELCHERKTTNGLWALQGGGSWIKNLEATQEFCRKNNIPYQVIGGLPHKDFLKELSKHEGLVFHPAGFDTNPRITIEAKILGLKLHLNGNVQQKDDEWFATSSRIDCLEYLKTLPQNFWSKL